MTCSPKRTVYPADFNGGTYDRATVGIRACCGEMLGGDGMELPAQLRPDTKTA
jgi:hypothetical protein